MIGTNKADPALCTRLACPDFRDEKLVLHNDVEEIWHMVVMSPKFHCECTGLSVGYSWGLSKLEYRKWCTFKARDLLATVKPSLSAANIPWHVAWAFATNTRDFIRGYTTGATGGGGY
jgi:hypothetical protein